MRHFELGMVIVCSVLLLAAFAPAQAASKKDPDREALRRVQLQIRQMENDKAVLEQDKASLSMELEDLKKKSNALTSSAASANRSKAALEKDAQKLHEAQAKLSEELERLKKELENSQSAERETRTNLQQETSLKQRLEANLGARGKLLDKCEANNRALYQYHVELINLAQNRGSLDVLLESEPVLGFKRVQIENLLEQYRDKLDTQKVQATSLPQAQVQQ